MKFQIETTDLRKALAHTQSVVERRNTVPILANVLMVVAGGKLTLSATDMEIAIVEDVDATNTSDGACTAPAALLYDIVRKLPAGTVEISHTGDVMTLRAGRYSTRMSTLAVEDFPSMLSGDLPCKFSLPIVDLRSAIDRTRFAISTEETRYYLGGIYMHVAEDGLRAVTTDGHRMAKVVMLLPQGAAEMPSVIIPRKTVNEVRKLLDEASGEIQIAVSDSRIQFRADGLALTSKLIDGTFPDYERVIPRGNDRVLRVERKALADAVGRVSAISSERSHPVKLAMSPGSLVITAHSVEHGTATEELAVEYDAEPMEIGFQARYLNDVTDVLGERVEILLADMSAPAVLHTVGDDSALYVLMPMRV